MSGIDDWYLDYAHRNELTPGFSPDDDIPDPFVPGEIPGREWVVPRNTKPPTPRKQARDTDKIRTLQPARRGGSWETAAKEWLDSFPEGTNRECLRALHSAGHTRASTKLIARLRATLPKTTQTRKKTTRKTPSPAKSVQGADRRRQPGSGARRRRAEEVPWHAFAKRWLREHPGASNRQWHEAIEEADFVGVTAKAVSALRREVKPSKSKSRRPVVWQLKRPPEQPVRADYCDGCGLAVNDDGRCNC